MLDGCGLTASSWACRAPRDRCTIWSWRSPSLIFYACGSFSWSSWIKGLSPQGGISVS